MRRVPSRIVNMGGDSAGGEITCWIHCDVIDLLLTIAFACGVAIAGIHVLNKRFIAPWYDVGLNLTAFTSATAASALLGHWLPSAFAALAVAAWLVLAVRTAKAEPAQRTGSSREPE